MTPIHSLSRAAFWSLSHLGRRAGGLRPRRVYHWLARHGFPTLQQRDYGWFRDPWGYQLQLNPYYLVDRDIIAFGVYDPALHAIIKQRVRPGAICMDVGAHIGSVAVHLAHCAGSTGRVYAFEPCPTLLERLKVNIARNQLEERIEIHGLALGNSVGRTKMVFAAPDSVNQGMGSIVGELRGRLNCQVDVEIQSLDSFVATHAIRRLDLVKVDIQGAECDFLTGGHNTIIEMRPDLLLEVSPIELQVAGKDTHTLLGQVESLGYQIYEVRNGHVGARLYPHDLPRDFTADNVLCISDTDRSPP